MARVVIVAMVVTKSYVDAILADFLSREGICDLLAKRGFVRIRNSLNKFGSQGFGTFELRFDVVEEVIVARFCAGVDSSSLENSHSRCAALEEIYYELGGDFIKKRTRFDYASRRYLSYSLLIIRRMLEYVLGYPAEQILASAKNVFIRKYILEYGDLEARELQLSAMGLSRDPMSDLMNLRNMRSIAKAMHLTMPQLLAFRCNVIRHGLRNTRLF
jgi:hypothetical protein